MKGFRYVADPLCLFSCALYAVNRCWLAGFSGSPFLQGYFDDLLLIPCALPVVLWVHARLGLRDGGAFPTLGEVGLHLLVWAAVSEWIGPACFDWAVRDAWDVAAYTAGAAAGALWWQWREARRKRVMRPGRQTMPEALPAPSRGG